MGLTRFQQGFCNMYFLKDLLYTMCETTIMTYPQTHFMNFLAWKPVTVHNACWKNHKVQTESKSVRARLVRVAKQVSLHGSWQNDAKRNLLVHTLFRYLRATKSCMVRTLKQRQARPFPLMQLRMQASHNTRHARCQEILHASLTPHAAPRHTKRHACKSTNPHLLFYKLSL